MRFNTTVESARWDEDAQAWRVALADGETLAARYLITATGFLSQPKAPDIAGIASFDGKVIHTTDWDDSSARGPPRRRHRHRGNRRPAHSGAGEVGRRPDRLPAHPDPGRAQVRPPSRRARQAAVRPNPAHPARRALAHRRDLRLHGLHRVLHHRPFRRLNIAAADLSKINRFPSIRDKDLRAKLTPDYDFGCKRPTFSNGYYRAFTKPHVHLQADGIDRVEADGIVNADGTRTAIDTLVLATGFDLWEANFPAIEVIGREGRNLGKWWRDTRFQAYQGVTMPYFPNFLSLASPYAFLGLNFFNTMEYQMRHMDRLFGEVSGAAPPPSKSPRTPTQLPRPDDRTGPRLVVGDRRLRDVALLLLQPPAARPPCCGRCRRARRSRKPPSIR